ncbi:glycosyltransferase family 4 protein [Aerococcus urinaeequi]|uniref:glycosyltransferase family 4 protein n=1 Tax=Aerococcus urinaeequi TaxID=51665 RepID=UPI003D6C4344
MKVLYLTNMPAPYRIDFFNELGKKCDLTVLFEKKFGSHRNKEWLSKESANFNSIFLKGIKIGHEQVICFSVKEYLNSELYDVIVIGGYSTPTGMFAIKYCKNHNIPFILNADGGMIGSDKIIKRVIKNYFIGSANAWLSTGRTTSEYLKHYGAVEEKIYIYPFTSIKKENIVHVNQIQKEKLKEKLKISNRPTVISVGSFIYRKGFDTLIKAWKVLDNDYNLIIIGGGERKAELEKLISDMSLKNVKLMEFLPSEKLSEFYQASDLFVLPTRQDIWGLVINEAMANSLPVITTENCVAGIELLSENGFIVPVDDSEMLTDRALDILKNENLRIKMSEKSLELIKAYTIENMAKIHINIFKNYKDNKLDSISK